MSNIFSKPAKEFEVNGNKIKVTPLKMGVLLQIKGLSNAVAEAFAKLKTVSINDYEKTVNSHPNPTETDKEAIDYVERTVHKAPDTSLFSMVMRNKQEGIKALFDCLFENNILETILRTSINVFKDVPEGELFGVQGDNAIDMPTAFELFMCVVEVNMGGFSELGKFSHLLDNFHKIKDQVSNSNSKTTTK